MAATTAAKNYNDYIYPLLSSMQHYSLLLIISLAQAPSAHIYFLNIIKLFKY